MFTKAMLKSALASLVVLADVEADKTVLCNAAVIRTGALGRHADREAIAKEINIDVSHIASLKPLDWIEFNRADLSLTKGRLGTKKVFKYAESTKQFINFSLTGLLFVAID